jgi:hypothetical protein
VSERDIEQQAPELPADFVVERRGQSDEIHIFLSIEGTAFELRSDDAHALGTSLLWHVEQLEEERLKEA